MLRLVRACFGERIRVSAALSILDSVHDTTLPVESFKFLPLLDSRTHNKDCSAAAIMSQLSSISFDPTAFHFRQTRNVMKGKTDDGSLNFYLCESNLADRIAQLDLQRGDRFEQLAKGLKGDWMNATDKILAEAAILRGADGRTASCFSAAVPQKIMIRALASIANDIVKFVPSTNGKKHQARRLVAAILVEVVHEVYNQHRGPFSSALGVGLDPHGEVSKQDLTNSIDALKAEIKKSKDRLRTADDTIRQNQEQLRIANGYAGQLTEQLLASSSAKKGLDHNNGLTEQLRAASDSIKEVNEKLRTADGANKELTEKLRTTSEAIDELNEKLRTASSLTQEQATQIKELGRRLVKSHEFTEQLQASYHEHIDKEHVKHCVTFELIDDWKQKAQRLASDLNESRQEVERLRRNSKGGVNTYPR